MRNPRKRIGTIMVAVLVAGVAISTRRYGAWYPTLVRTYGGDTLYAVFVYIMLCALWPRGRVVTLGALALLGCFGVEFSQRLEWGWLASLRDTTVGGLILGHGFLWSDMVCYTVGVALAMGVDGVRGYWGRGCKS